MNVKKWIVSVGLVVFPVCLMLVLAPRSPLVTTYALAATTLTSTSGTVTLDGQQFSRNLNELECWTFTWVSDALGAADGYTNQVRGTIERVTFNPDDVSTPTDNYDVTLLDIDGIDVLNGTGANRDTANSEGTVTTEGDGTTYLPFSVVGRLTLYVTNAGATKSGVVRVYLRR